MPTEIKIFKPWDFKKSPLDLTALNALVERDLQYASQGRASFYHILKSLDVREKILIPTYICESILTPLTALGITPIFYDIDPDDLNGSLESIKSLSEKYSVRTVLLASLYGNPANLLEAEEFCREKGLLLIDDGAQSFGATLEKRAVTSFGDGGFFSFSPGKPTAAHMGSFFWSRKNYGYKGKSAAFSHLVKYLNFYFNRLHCYDFKLLWPFKFMISKLDRLMDKLSVHFNDNISAFEKPLLGGVLKVSLSGARRERADLIDKANQLIEGKNSMVRSLKTLRGEPHNHKIVWIFNEAGLAQLFSEKLKNRQIFTLAGFDSLGDNWDELPHMKSLAGRIVEIPIEPDAPKMKWLFYHLKSVLIEIQTKDSIS